jgi:hypothetical protein
MPETVPTNRRRGRPKNSDTPPPTRKPKRSTKPKSLAEIRKPGHRGVPSPGHTDLHRWFQAEGLGMSVEQIAAKEKRKTWQVQASLDYVKEWKARNRVDMIETKFVEVAFAQMDEVSKALSEGLKAEKVIHVDRATGEVKQVPDIAMRLKTVDKVRNLVETAQPKTPGLQLNQQFNAGLTINGSPAGNSFEAILRKKREARGLLNAQSEEAIEAEMTHAEAVADEFKDLGGDDDGDEDDDAE